MGKRYNHLFDRHLGDTCIIIGNGPSLNSVPDEFLMRYHTFGSNRIYLRFTPTYYVCVNPLVLEQYSEEITQVGSVARFIREGCGFPIDHELHSIGVPMFSFCPDRWIYEGFTVTFVSMQLAFFMGFKTVLLVGVDHRYKFEGKPNEETVMGGDDPNHFTGEYFKGSKWNNPDLARSEEAYQMAKEAYELNGRRIINMTEGSALTVFPVAEAEWLK